MRLPEPRLWLVRDPDDAPASAHAAHALGDLDHGVIFARVTPNPRLLHWMALDLLRALGKDPTRPGTGRNGEENWRRCAAWLSGEQVRHLIVDRAEMLQPNRWHDLIALAAHCGASLSLIAHGAALNRGQREFVAEWPLTEITFAEFTARHQARAADDDRSSSKLNGPEHAPFPVLPGSDFTTFRADCRVLLEQAEFHRVDFEMRAAAKRTRQWFAAAPERDEDAVKQHLRALIEDCPSTGQALARLRAAQAVCLMQGLLVAVDPERLAATTNTARPAVDQHLVRQLRAYASTQRAAAALIACVTRASPEAISQLNMADLTDGAVRVGGTAFAVPGIARGVLAAHVHHRQAAGAQADDPLFSDAHRGDLGHRTSPRAMHRAIDDVARSSGLMLWGEPTCKEKPSRKHWLTRRGISVQVIR